MILLQISEFAAFLWPIALWAPDVVLKEVHLTAVSAVAFPRICWSHGYRPFWWRHDCCEECAIEGNEIDG